MTAPLPDLAGHVQTLDILEAKVLIVDDLEAKSVRCTRPTSSR
jgi:hypothetical protein